ncbi:hypothetical protein [Flavobacterium dankookense]|uniref:Uncharacterized protein n=1 Tax=Flavobacterium dankookense TaxID=706186 RepID=A0A4R6QGS9_9FLAO|nr:hypothetical protein [Flavobacterium dankookense]TDP61744.1 hypothetical protein BC748_0160 [Flavobacterium dankookense]
MRFTAFCLLFLLLSSCKTTFRRIDVNSISETEKQKVYNFGKRIVETCKTRQFIQLTQREVTKSLSELSLAEMQHACDVLDKRNGKFIDMKLIEVIDDTFTRGSKIYRYKANFERNDFVNEVRIWLNTDGKFAGIIWKEWKDDYIPHK